MIRRINKVNNDLKDIIKAKSDGVIENIYSIRYFIFGNESNYITPEFTREGDIIEVAIPSQELKKLSDGILYRKAFYKVVDEEYPDLTRDIEMVDNLNIWLEGDPAPVPPHPSVEYLTEGDLKTINGQSLVGEGDIHIEGGDVDLSDYFTKEETETKIAQHILANNGRLADEYYNREAIDAKMDGKVGTDNIKTINGQSLIGEGDIHIQGGGGSLTPEQEDAVNTLVDSSKGMLYTETLDLRHINRYDFEDGETRVFNLDGRVIINRWTTLYEFKDLGIHHLGQILGSFNYYNPMWTDMSGRVYWGDSKVYFDTMTAGQADLNCGNLSSSYNKCNIFKGQNAVYLYGDNWYQVFDEESQMFGEPQPYNNEDNFDYWFFMVNQIQFGDRLISIYNNQTYELVEDGDGIHPEVVDNPFDFDSAPFTVEGMRMVYIDGTWYYMPDYPYNGTYRLVDDTWEQMNITYPSGTVPYYQGYGVVADNMVISYFSEYLYAYNLTENGKKVTSWTPVESKVVDLESNQTIGGSKYFKNTIQVPGVATDSVGAINPNLRLAANGNINLDAPNGFVNLPANTLVDGDPAASKSDTIQSRQLTFPGRIRKNFPDAQGDISRMYCVAFNNKMYHNSWVQWIFDGETAVNAEGLFPNAYIDLPYHAKITSSRFFLMENGNLYELVDNEFVIREEGTHETSWVFPYEDTLVDFNDGQKLNTSTWEWEDWVGFINNFHDAFRTFVFNGATYSANEYNLTIFNPDTASFETCVEYRDSNGNQLYSNGNHFTHNGHIYVNINNNWHMVDLENRTIILQREINVMGDGFICSLNGRTYTMEDNIVKMFYNLEYTKPEVPGSDGTYVLKATRVGDQITYTWAAESSIWTGTQAEWDLLTDEEQRSYMIALIK